MTKTRAAAMLMLVAATALACATAQKKQAPKAAGGFIALSVADIDKVVPFYRDVLGFQIFSEGTAPDRPVRFALMQRESHLVEILQMPDAVSRAEIAPGRASHQIHGVFKAGLVVPDIDREFRRLQQLHVTFEYELTQPPGGPLRSFGLRDPEGNLIQYFGR